MPAPTKRRGSACEHRHDEPRPSEPASAHPERSRGTPQAEPALSEAAAALPHAERLLWAELFRRTWGGDALECSRCKGRLPPIAVLHDPDESARQLAYAGDATRTPVARCGRRRCSAPSGDLKRALSAAHCGKLVSTPAHALDLTLSDRTSTLLRPWTMPTTHASKLDHDATEARVRTRGPHGLTSTCAVWTDTRSGKSAVYLSCRGG